MSRFLIVILVVIFLFSISALSLAQSTGKIGYVDLSRAFDEYQKTKDSDKSLEQKSDAKQKEREKLVDEIKKMRDELELLSESAKPKKQEAIDDRIKKLQEFDQEAKNELRKERDAMVRDILKEMNEVVAEYGQREGYAIILNDRVLLYSDKALDLTDQIIKVLNERYKKK